MKLELQHVLVFLVDYKLLTNNETQLRVGRMKSSAHLAKSESSQTKSWLENYNFESNATHKDAIQKESECG